MTSQPNLQAFHESMRERAEELLRCAELGTLTSANPDLGMDRVATVLERATQWDGNRFNADAETFNRIYRRDGVLPPDRYRNVVFQPATGCAWNRCNFCELYADQDYRVRDGDAFAQHVSSVLSFFGRALAGRRGVFLGSASALSLSQPRLTLALQTIRTKLAECGHAPADAADIAAFFDPHRSPVRSAHDYAMLARAGLSNVIIGLESGSDHVLSTLNKGGRAAAVVESVRRTGPSGLTRTIVVLAGLGDRQLEREHRLATVSAICDMELDPDDRVFVSPLPKASRADVAALHQALSAKTSAHVAMYRLGEFEHFA